MSTFSPESLLSEANNAQRQAITHENGPLLILAGAGTGKTNVITKRIAWLIATERAKPDQILSLTFTDKAAAEMEERVDRLLPYGYVDLAISTFHSFGERILRERGLEIGLSTNFSVLNETSQWLLLRKHWDKLELDYYRPLGNPTKFIKALITHFSRAEDELVSPDEYLKKVKNLKLDSDVADGIDEETEQKRLTEIANAYHFYKRLLREEESLDFSDLINETLRLFTERPNILREFHKQYPYVLVDEFQDTNYAQYQLVRLLAGDSQNITVVGDDDQSIYKFRGASVSNILDFESDYPKAKRVVLTTNYRSKQEILDMAYSFIQNNNPDRLEVKLGGAVSKKLEAHKGTGGAVVRIHGKSVGDEARLVLEQIRKIKDKNLETSWNDFAILVRANDHAEPFLTALRTQGIPYEFVASRGLYTTPIVIDILAYMRVLIDPYDSPSLYRLLSSSIVKISNEDLVTLTHHARKKAIPLYKACQSIETITGISKESVDEVRNLLVLLTRQGIAARKEPVSRMLLSFLHDTGYLKSLAGQDEAAVRNSMRVLQQLWKQIEQLDVGDEETTVRSFLDQVRMQLDAGDSGHLPPDPEAGPELVRVMTIHSAKGLEFRYVFVVNLVDKRFPTINRRESIPLHDMFIKERLPEGDAHIQEERRLFYVAATRAKDTLFLTSAEEYGGLKKKKLSRFLEEAELTNAAAQVREPTIEIKPVKTSVNQKLRIPERMSFTQFAAFSNCPLQYKYEHLLRIPKRGNENQSFGQSVHGTLQELFERYRARTQVQAPTLFDTPETPKSKGIVEKIVTHDELLEIYQEKFIDDWYRSESSKKERYELGRKILSGYYNQIRETSPDILGLEIGFTLKFKSAAVKGRIDRIDRLEDGSVHIIDYKSGRVKEKPDWDQLLIYQLAALRVLSLKPSRMTYLFLDGGVEKSHLATDDELTLFDERIDVLVQKIRSSDFAATPSKRICRFCDFKHICDSYVP